MQNFLANNEWAKNSSFDHFWRHYAVCDEWRKQHFEAVRQAQSHTREEPEVVERLSRCGIREEEEQEVENQEWHKFQQKTKEHRQKFTVHSTNTQNHGEHRDAAAEYTARKENARELYGAAAERILARESLLEMRFEEAYWSNPQMWPNIPFRF
uniref:Gem-associated protein 8 n=1 Tax=Caenorhabditis japonica TaxID=281687 RepID=A0A8R1ETQ2_CAEJA